MLFRSIGFHVCQYLLERGDQVLGIDSVNDYYDPVIKRARLAILGTFERFSFRQGNLADEAFTQHAFDEPQDRVIHLAAQAGVRYSLVNPMAYVESNIIAFTRVLEACRHREIAHLTYASTSSVYGANTSMPFSEHQGVDHPLQFYAASKRANELMAHSYSHLFALPTTGLRFFTVYGPWGRPDMAPWLFADAILAGRPITLYEGGRLKRDFTFVEDIVAGVLGAQDLDGDIAAEVLVGGGVDLRHRALADQLTEAESTADDSPGERATLVTVRHRSASVPSDATRVVGGVARRGGFRGVALARHRVTGRGRVRPNPR